MQHWIKVQHLDLGISIRVFDISSPLNSKSFNYCKRCRSYIYLQSNKFNFHAISRIISNGYNSSYCLNCMFVLGRSNAAFLNSLANDKRLVSLYTYCMPSSAKGKRKYVAFKMQGRVITLRSWIPISFSTPITLWNLSNLQPKHHVKCVLIDLLRASKGLQIPS